MGNTFTNFYFGLDVKCVQNKINKNRLDLLTDNQLERIIYHYKIEDISLLLNIYNIKYIQNLRYNCKKIYQKRNLKYINYSRILTSGNEQIHVNDRLLRR